jgi:hypothetical protein
MITPVQFKHFQDLGWEFSDHTDSSISFNYKSPRLRDFAHFLSEGYGDLNEELILDEKIVYLIQLKQNIARQTQALQNDVMRQVKIHVDRDLPLPPELKVDLTIKIV